MKRRSSFVESGRKLEAIQSSAKKLTPIAKVAPAQQREGVELIGRTCAVLGCDVYKRLPNDMFFRFPEEASLRRVWTEMTGRAGWTPTDYSYVCAEHFTADCLRRDAVEPGSVPTLHLPAHVMQVEYVNEEILDKEIIPKRTRSESDSEPEPSLAPSEESHKSLPRKRTNPTVKLELLKLFSEVQTKQKRVVSLSKRLRHDKLMHRMHSTNIQKLKEQILIKEKQLKEMKATTKPKIDDRMDKNAILILPAKYTDEVRSFALNIYDKSPEAYVYLRNTLRTLLPETDEVERWTRNGFQPARVMTSSTDCVKIVTEAKERELSCKVSIV